MSQVHELDVVIVNYNSGQALEQCVKTLMGCARIDINITVVDNDSSDNSWACIEKVNESISRPIKLIKNPSNDGFSSACNQGAESCHSKHLAFINPDCFIQPQQLIQLSKQLDQYPSAALVGCRVLNEDGSMQAASRRRLPTFWRIICHLSGLYKSSFFKGININDSGQFDSVQEVEAVNGACILLKREAFDQVAGFDEGYPLHFEDLDLFTRLQAENFTILYDARIEVIHLKGHSAQDSQKIKAWKKQGLLRYLSKHRPKWEHSLAKLWLS